MFLKNVEYVSPPSDPIVPIEFDNDDNFLPKNCCVSKQGFEKLVCLLYIEKHKLLFDCTPVGLVDILQVIKKRTADLNQLLKWVGYNSNDDLDFSQFTCILDFCHRICFVKHHGSKDLFKYIPPSDAALDLHKKRVEYVISMALYLNNFYLPTFIIITISFHLY